MSTDLELIQQVLEEKRKEQLINELLGVAPERTFRDKGRDFLEGMQASGLSALYGVKDLAGTLTPEDRAHLEEVKQQAGESGWGTGGRIVGELAQFAIPGGLALKGAKFVNAGSKMLPLALEAGVVGAQGYARLPEAGETRKSNAYQAAGAGLVGAGLGKVLRPLVGRSAVDLKPEAEELIALGGYITPGKAAQGKFIRGLETLMEVTPFTARSAKQELARSKGVFAKVAAKQAVPEGYAGEITEEGVGAIGQAQKVYDDLYKQAWGDVGQFSKAGVSAAQRSILTAADERQLNRVLSEIDSLFAKGNVSAKKVDDILAKQIARLRNDRTGDDLRQVLKELQEQYLGQLSPERTVLLETLKAKWPEMLALRKAGKAIRRRGAEEFSPKDYLGGIGKVASERDINYGIAKGQRVAELGQATVGQKAEGAPLEFLRRLSYMAPSPPGMRAVGKFGTGQYQWQQGLARSLREPEEYLKFWADPYRAGAAYEE
jgi:hypothetical protein